jgi:hypothetical protein
VNAKMLVRDITAVKGSLGIYSVMIAVAACSIYADSQAVDKNKAPGPKAAELKLRIIPDRETYSLHDKALTKAELINLTNKTLCFPEPARNCEDTSSGSLITTSESAVTGEREWFHCHIDGRGVPREELVAEIEQHWIKLAPNAAYVTKSAEAYGDLFVVGQWRLKAIYRPPKCSFNIAECANHIRSAAQSVGCTVPEMASSAKPVTVNVVPPPGQK